MNSRVDVTLIKKAYTPDEIGQLIPTETTRTVSGYIESSSLAEFSSGGENGLRRDKRVLVWTFEYEGEDEIEVGGIRYTIYRVYYNANGKAELYLERRVSNG